MFQTLHTMFEQQYTELWTALDEVAERIRSLGEPAPGSYKTFAKLTSIKEEEGVPEAKDMVRQLVAGHEAVAKTARRSEEHTSELQSLMRISYAVFCLKKKKTTKHNVPAY